MITMAQMKFTALKPILLLISFGLSLNVVLANSKIIRLYFSRKIIVKTAIDYEEFAKINPLIKEVSFWAADYRDSVIAFSLGLFIADDNKKSLPITTRNKLIVGAYKDTSLYVVCDYSCNFIEQKNFIRYDDSYFEVMTINVKKKYIELRKSTYKKFNTYKNAALFEYISKIPSGVSIKGFDDRYYDLHNYLDTTKYTLLQFWAYWCPPCSYDVKIANELFDQKKSSLNIIGINCDITSSKSDILKYIDEKKIKWNIGLDDKKFSKKLLHLYGSAPLSILFDKTGNLIKLYPSLSDINNLIEK